MSTTQTESVAKLRSDLKDAEKQLKALLEKRESYKSELAKIDAEERSLSKKLQDSKAKLRALVAASAPAPAASGSTSARGAGASKAATQPGVLASVAQFHSLANALPDVAFAPCHAAPADTPTISGPTTEDPYTIADIAAARTVSTYPLVPGGAKRVCFGFFFTLPFRFLSLSPLHWACESRFFFLFAAGQNTARIADLRPVLCAGAAGPRAAVRGGRVQLGRAAARGSARGGTELCALHAAVCGRGAHSTRLWARPARRDARGPQRHHHGQDRHLGRGHHHAHWGHARAPCKRGCRCKRECRRHRRRRRRIRSVPAEHRGLQVLPVGARDGAGARHHGGQPREPARRDGPRGAAGPVRRQRAARHAEPDAVLRALPRGRRARALQRRRARQPRPVVARRRPRRARARLRRPRLGRRVPARLRPRRASSASLPRSDSRTSSTARAPASPQNSDSSTLPLLRGAVESPCSRPCAATSQITAHA